MEKLGDKIMFLFPHPDDETFACGGLIYDLVKKRKEIYVLCLTKGEASTLRYHGTEEILASVREREFIEVMKYLGVSNYTILDLGDGQLETNPLTGTIVANQIDKVHPSTVITYEPCGIYGHPDHVYLSKVVSELALQSSWRLIYSTVAKGYEQSKDSLKMAKDPDNVHPIEPNFEYKLSLTTYIAKMKALKIHKSQVSATADIKQTLKFLWYLRSEYYHLVDKKRVASRGIVIRNSEVLLIHRINKGQEYYSIPGGKVEDGETNEQTVEREIHEETTINVKAKNSLGFFEDTNKCSHLYLCDYISGEPSLEFAPEKEEMERHPDNFYDPQWIPIAQALELTVQPKSAAATFKEYLRKVIESKNMDGVV